MKHSVLFLMICLFSASFASAEPADFVGKVYKIVNCSQGETLAHVTSLKLEFPQGEAPRVVFSYDNKASDIRSLIEYYRNDRCGHSEYHFSMKNNGFSYYQSGVSYSCGPNPNQPYRFYWSTGLSLTDDGAKGTFYYGDSRCEVVRE